MNLNYSPASWDSKSSSSITDDPPKNPK
jgi:hypothetical protein